MDILEKEFWKDFIHSPDHKYLLGVLKEHRDYLNKEALRALSDDKTPQAIRFQAKAEDAEKIVDLIQERIRESGVI